MKRVSVVGQSGSGKTTLAGRLSETLELPHIELDAIHWQADWKALEQGEFRRQVAEALQGERWVVDGNYPTVQDLVLGRADTVVWLDYPLATIFRQLTPRIFRRVFLREPLWNGNRERFVEQFFSRNSLYLWVLKTQKAKKQRYEAMIGDPAYAHFQFVRLRSRKALHRWLEDVTRREKAQL